MGFNDPRVPAAYPALDSAIFSAAGGPALDALILDTIAQAHNRLQSAGAQMFSACVPTRGITHGDLTVPSYTQPASTTWAPFVPALPHRKKPGHRFADYRAIVQAPSGVDFELQVVTRAAPYTARPAGGLSQIVQATGTGAWQTVAIDGVPVDPGVEEASALLVRTEEVGAAHVAGTYGTPVSGTGVKPHGDGLIIFDAGAVSWNDATSAPNDYGTRGFFLEFTDSNGDVLALLQLHYLEVAPGSNMLAFFDRPPPSRLTEHVRLNGGVTDWKLYDPVRISLAAFAGATADRSP